MNKAPSIKAVHLRIEGRVQGVWFRYWVCEQALSRGLDGWVRNLSDGAVEALFSGSADAVDEISDVCWKGPPLARVDNIILSSAEPVDYRGFKKLPTL